MKQLRPLIIGLPMLLAGCSTFSNFSWSSLSPFNWFGGAVTVKDAGVGGINAATPLDPQALNKALNGDYRLRSGMETHDGGIRSLYQGVKDNEVRLTVYGSAAGRVDRVVVTDKDVASEWGVKVGTRFSSLYGKAFGACRKSADEDQNGVICAAPQSAHVSYVFTGNWHGPDSLMPADDILKDWQVSQIVWQAGASQ
ncbi:RpoE-regulated lipoprotein [Acerihabitans sp. KWT182]|uniref:RpoE-regulated lipoprotein n=1 Tax=Acerihabitans sp. KWT182 TaxID=3157919 RepID=A0AAU7Q6Q1_9GAMM